jgi:hypothetical protein
MQKKAAISLLATLVVAIVALFVCNEVIAQCNPPECFVSKSGYQVEIVKSEGGEFPVPDTCIVNETSTPCWKYEYSITGPARRKCGSYAVSQIDMLIPVCDPNPISILGYNPSGFQQYNPGQGDSTTNFGIGDLQDYVIKWTYKVNPGDTKRFWVETSLSKAKETSMALKVGSKLEAGVILGPACPPAPIGARTSTECANFGQDTPNIPNDDVSFYIVRRSDQEGCIYSIWACTGNYCPGCVNESCTSEQCEQVVPEGQDIHTVLQGSLIRSCPDENVSVSTGSPFYLYTWNSGGVTYKKCLDLANGKYTTMCCCKGTCPCP